MYRQKLAETRSVRSAIINALLKTLEAKSHETEQHVLRMQEVGVALARQLELPHSELNRLKLAILLHDIGKITVPEEILRKPGPLTPEEWERVKKHPEVGYRIARATPEFAQVAEEIYAHHERFDGSGYPRGLQGEAIPLLARIIAIADAYDTMRYGRPYKKPLKREAIIAEFRKNAGTQFDPKLVDIFLALFEQGAFD
jgi:putative nucleotidyltransferase with HDIG domain